MQPYRYALLAVLVIALSINAIMLATRDVWSHQEFGFQLFPPAHIKSPDKCGDDRTVVLDVITSQRLALNNEPVDFTRLHDKLIEIYSTRPERVLFVRGRRDVDVSDVARAIDIANSIPDLHIGLLTPRVNEPCLLINVPAPKVHPKLPENF